VYQYARGDGDLLEDVGKRDWVFDAPPRTHKYLVVCSHDKEGWQSFRKYETQVEAYLGVDMNASNTLFLGEEIKDRWLSPQTFLRPWSLT
jgi:hypothetical protein